jgi:uncharacterized protein YutE (UPF0331/DUF86 family)
LVYYINHTEIKEKQAFLVWLADSSKLIPTDEQQGILKGLAQERILHLAMECVTDVGNLLIDGFMMRDPSSYEDIIEILKTEQVVDEATADGLFKLVRYRRTLLQEYTSLDREKVHPLMALLPNLLTSFASQTAAYVEANQL